MSARAYQDRQVCAEVVALVLNKSGQLVRREQVRNEWLNSSAASSRETVGGLNLNQLVRDLKKDVECRKSGSRFATRLIGVPSEFIPTLI